MKKRIFPLLLLLSPYLYAVILFVCDQVGYKITDSQDAIIIGLIAAVFIANMVYPFVAAKWKSSRELLFWDMLIKLCYIPIYVLVFIVGVFFLLVPKGIVLLVFFVVFDYLLLLPSTMYGVSGLIKARKEGKIPMGIAVIGAILHFFFCADVICAIVVYCIVKARDIKEVPAA